MISDLNEQQQQQLEYSQLNISFRMGTFIDSIHMKL